MLKGCEVVFFLTCYFIAFLIELLRLRFKQSSIYRWTGFSILVLGSLVHVISLYRNDLLQNNHFFASASGWFCVLAFGLAAVLVYLSLVYRRVQFGFFLYPLIFVTLGFGLCASDITFSEASTCRWVRIVHGASLFLATLISFLGAIAGVMFFIQRSRLKRKIFSSAITLPSLEWLGCATRHASNAAVIALGMGVASGFYLKLFVPEQASSSEAWVDPVVVGAIVLFLGVLFSRFYRKNSPKFDINAKDAALVFSLCITLLVLLLFAAFEGGGHWRSLVRPSLNSAQQIDENREAYNKSDFSTKAIPDRTDNLGTQDSSQ